MLCSMILQSSSVSWGWKYLPPDIAAISLSKLSFCPASEYSSSVSPTENAAEAVGAGSLLFLSLAVAVTVYSPASGGSYWTA